MKHCIVCGKELPREPLFVLEDAPASAQDIPDEEQVKSDEGVTLGLYRCRSCGLVQFDCTPVSYYRDVIRAGGFSTTMTGLRREQYRHLIETYHLEGKKFLEVGCGRGEFLQVLTEFPVQAYGMENKADLVRIAQQSGLCVWREFPERADQRFAKDCASERPGGMPDGLFDVFLSFNFLEHQPRPDVMLKAIYHNLSENGMGLVTVPALEYIVELGSYYELIRDHIAYYSFDVLRGLLAQCGFEVLEEEMLNRDTISMVVRKVPGMDFSCMEAEAGADDMAAGRTHHTVDALVQGYNRVQQDMNKLLAELGSEKKTLAVWGASHQGFTLAATTGLGKQALYIIDSAPFKQGRFAPSSHLPIMAPEHFFEQPVDVILIVAPGYTDEIAGSIRQKFGKEVKILTMRTDHVEYLDV